MRNFSIFLLFGSMLIQLFTAPLSLLFIVFLIILLFISLFAIFKFEPHLLRFLLFLFSALLLGLILSALTANHQLNSRLPTEFEGKDILLEGIVKDIPDNRKDGVRFKFKVLKAHNPADKKQLEITGVVKLGWFQKRQQIRAGEQWQLRVRLKRPSGFMNPGGFDYEKWLFTQKIIATGYIRKGTENHRIHLAPWWSINHLREKINQEIQNKVKNKESAALLSALAVADRNNMDDSQWQVLKDTGTSHLIAISGLHIAIIAGFSFFLIMLIWRIFPRLNEEMSLQLAGGIAGVIFATIYALLAGFTLPTQRALLMVIVILIGLVSRKNYSSSTTLAIALLAVLMLDPLAAMTISFWLSFSAVALILMILKRQIIKSRFQMLRLQLFLSLGMLPLTLIFFGEGSLSAPIANLIAIPWVSILVVPLTLLGVIFLPLSEFISSALLNLAGFSIHYLFQLLTLISNSSISSVGSDGVPLLYLLFAMFGVLFLLLPKGFPARWLGLILFLPALLFVAKVPEQGAFSFSLLDAGQGTASVIHTSNHTLIYDAGTRLSSSFDIGKLVVIPYLKSKGVQSVDMMILSHDNLDHRGGAKAIINEIHVKEVLSSDTDIVDDVAVVKLCIAGQRWQWDDVDFEIIWPMEDTQLNENNRSCVLRVSNAYHSLLLTGDIQRKAEQRLIKSSNERLQSEVILMPHHGSKTSSTLPFLEAVSPSLALISAGYRNRFGHPKQKVIDRYDALSIQMLNTINAGAIEVDFPVDDKPIETQQYRVLKRRFWNR